ncbi:PP2C family protein-serine/threonine phosphatase [Actinomadura harenae]|uniref:Serine/threonine-protein phosphatase n=1 Tax=Actinomadura harenae TaxID=2483351 RepID=A0A3M2LVJ2_9ACTN|nr:PP2C family protein-serine/threonine phosphatase [Actinomadura harenae]RMI40573.1 serine/threonine-protein phosphatase [Actinomadura harenae]
MSTALLTDDVHDERRPLPMAWIRHFLCVDPAACLPLAALLVVAAADLCLPGGGSVIGLLIAVPVLAGLRPSSTRFVVVTGAATLATLGVLETSMISDDLLRFGAVIGGVLGTTAMMAVAARSRERSDHAQADLRAITDTMRRAVLRPAPYWTGGVRTRVRYLADAGEAGLGGDLYSVMETSYGVRVIVGDVRGKGLAAVEQAADVLGAFRELAHNEPTLTGVALRLDGFLARRGGAEDFVTALLVQIPPGGDAAEVVNCGHPPPLLLSLDGASTFVDALPPAPPLGLIALAGDACPPGPLPLPSGGGHLLLYTDGVTESRDAAGRFYPLAERAAALVHPDPDVLLDALEADLHTHAGGRLQDDATLLSLDVDPVSTPRPCGGDDPGSARPPCGGDDLAHAPRRTSDLAHEPADGC